MGILKFTNTGSTKVQFTNTASSKLQVTSYRSVTIDATLTDDILSIGPNETSSVFVAISNNDSLPNVVLYLGYVYLVYNLGSGTVNIYQSDGTDWVSKSHTGFNGNVDLLFRNETIMYESNRQKFIKFKPRVSGDSDDIGLYIWKPSDLTNWNSNGLVDGQYDLEVTNNIDPSSVLLPNPYPAVPGYKAGRIKYPTRVVSTSGLNIVGIVTGVPGINTSASTLGYYLSDNASIYLCTGLNDPAPGQYQWTSTGGYTRVLPSNFTTWGTEPVVIYNNNLSSNQFGFFYSSSLPNSLSSRVLTYPTSERAIKYYRT